MKRVVCFWAAWAAVCLMARAQEADVLRAALFLSGASSEEEVDPDWVELLESRGGSRIRINDARPRAGGLLTEYQLASLADYRSRHGDILSWEELALVDGFTREAVAALKPFLSLDSTRLPGSTDTLKTRARALLRYSLKAVGGKMRVDGPAWRLGAAWRGRDGTFHGEYNWRRLRAVAGDFNVRWGQGLAVWSGFSMESLSTVAAFNRRSGGIAPVWSFNSAPVFRGGAVEWAPGRFKAAAFASFKGDAAVHAEWLARMGQLGITATRAAGGAFCVAVDGRVNWKGMDLAGEAAWKGYPAGRGSPALRMAFGTPVADGGRLALQLRLLPSRFSGKKAGEYGLAAGWAWRSSRWQSLSGRTGFGSSVPAHELSLTADVAALPLPGTDPERLQIRAWASWKWQFAPAWALELRLTERYRSYERPRTAVRADLRYGSGPWQGTFRNELVRCGKAGWLSYLEGGRKEGDFSLFGRVSVFATGSWDARVYCYERDVPGSFSVPAYAGRGLSFSCTGGWKGRLHRWRFRVDARGACTFRMDRTPAWTLNLQLQADR